MGTGPASSAILLIATSPTWGGIRTFAARVSITALTLFHSHAPRCARSGDVSHRPRTRALLASLGVHSLTTRCGFQTGNVAQLGIAVARTFDPIGERTYHFDKPDQQALCSVLSFLIGTSLGRIGDKMGAKKRTWLVLATFIQCLCCLAAALAAHYSGESAYAQ